MASFEQPRLRRNVVAGPLGFLFALLLSLFLLTSWFDEVRRQVLPAAAVSRTVALEQSEPFLRFRGLENAGGFGIVVGLALAFLVWHPRRALGLVPIAATLWFCTLLLLYLPLLNAGLAFASGLTAGLASWPLMMTVLRRSGLTGPFPPRDRLWLVLAAPLGLAAGLLIRLALNGLPVSSIHLLVASITGGAVLLAWWLYSLHFLELLLELILFPIYRFTFVGPGVHLIPVQGPALVIANHSCMLDPLFIGKIVPRRLIPVMTAKYYDLPVMRFLMKHVVGTIRVPVVDRRAEAPELAAMIDALDKGHCLLMFPEGKLRREGDPELSYFNQGLWRVLHARPATPVVCCWIENAWGSYFSYKDGPPMKGKSWDWFRPIQIAVAEPEVLPAETLATHQATRRYLTDKVGNLKELAAGRPALQVVEPEVPPPEPETKRD